MNITIRLFGFLLVSSFALTFAGPARAVDTESRVKIVVVPNAPSGFVATAPSPSQVSLTWTDNSSEEDGFVVERKIGVSGTYSQIGTVGANITTYLDNSVSANTTYFYRTAAYIDNLLSLYGNEASVTTPSSAPPPSSGGGGGGGGGGNNYVPPPTQVVFSGRAYPKSSITLLKDAQVAAITVADASANFQITLSNFTGGTYNFGIWAEDYKGNRSITQQFNISLSTGATTLVSGIFIPPTISIDKTEVAKGDVLNILGQSLPGSAVSIRINSEKELLKKTAADKDGVWLYKFDTGEIESGNHFIKANSSKDGDITTFSETLSFLVGTRNVLTPEKKCPNKGDPNDDCRVNLVDFSVLAYWYKRPLTKEVAAKVDLNGDGKINLVDFSIMAYYWSG